MNIDIYKDAIQDVWVHLILQALPMFVFGAALIVVSLIAWFQKFLNKLLIIFFLVLAAAGITLNVIDLSSFGSEIRNNGFEVYCGGFDYMISSGKNNDTFRNPDGSVLRINGVRLRGTSDLNIGSGSYSGYLLYGKKTGWVIAYSATPFDWYDGD